MKHAAVASATLALCLASAALAQVKLEFKHPEGKTTTVTTSKSHQVLTIAGMDVETDAESVTTSSATVEKPLPDGSVKIHEKVEAMTMTLNLPGAMKVTYDSKMPDAKSDVPAIQAILDGLRAMDGKTYTLVVGKDHRVTRVEGVQQIIETAPAAAVDELKRSLDPEKLKRQTHQAYAVLPDKPVNKGDKWIRTEVSDIGGGQTLTFQKYYEYQGTVEKGGKTLEKIGFYIDSVSYALDPNGAIPVKVVNSDLKVGFSSGTLLFDRDAGQIVETTSTIRMSGPMTFSVNGVELPGKVDLTIESNSVKK
jgi:hypothetical protein